MTRPRHPLVIFGLDGATFDLLDPLMTAGHLPTLRRLCQCGWRTELRSTVPPVTLPAWTSFLTGSPPSRHGVTDLLGHIAHSYDLRPQGGGDRQLPTFLARLSSAGLRVASIGVPGTFPPEPIDGLVISGFDAPGASHVRPEGIWPKAYRARVAHHGGWRFATFNEQGPAHRRLPQVGAALLRDLDHKEALALELFHSAPWDLFFLHLQASDTVAHHLWQCFDTASPRHEHPELGPVVTRVFQRLDALISRLLAQTPSNTRVLIVSDHGMGGASDTAIYLNRWLAEHGFLTFARGSTRLFRQASRRTFHAALAHLPESWVGAVAQRTNATFAGRLLSLGRQPAIDWEQTQAFSDEFDFSPSIWLNTERQFPRGGVSDMLAPALLTRLRAELLTLCDPMTGARLLERVLMRSELPPGPHTGRFPDLILTPAWPRGYRPSFLTSDGPGPAVRRLPPIERNAGRGSGMPGVHHPVGVFIAAGPGLHSLELPSLDLPAAGTLVYPLMGMPVPEELAQAVPDFMRELLPIDILSENHPLPLTVASSPQNASMLAHLRSMGYID